MWYWAIHGRRHPSIVCLFSFKSNRLPQFSCNPSDMWHEFAHKIVGLEFEIFIKNVVAVAAYIRHSLSQWPSRSQGWTFLSSFLSRNPSFIPAYVTSRLCYKMAESRDRSSSTEPQLKFPGCSHYRRRMDNHFRCQQCRYNEGLTLCTQ